MRVKKESVGDPTWVASSEVSPRMLTAAELERKTASLLTFPSGSSALDMLLGGGYRQGSLVEFLGRSNSGKTQLAMQAALCVARLGREVLYIDTEGSFRPERMEGMARSRGWEAGRALEKVTTLRTDSYAEQIELASEMSAREATAYVSLVVVDTLTRNFTIGFPGKSNLPERQGAIGRYLSVLARDACLNLRSYILTNRVTFGTSRDVAIGGKTVEQMVSESVLLGRERTSVRAMKLSTGEFAVASIGPAGVE